MFWSIETDDFQGYFCKNGKFPLIRTVSEIMKSGAIPTNRPTIPPTSSAIPTISSETTTSSGSGSVVNCDKQGDYYVRDPKDCTKYYRCFSGRKFTFNCASGLFFDPQIIGCNWPELVNCY
jgi:chitinase